MKRLFDTGSIPSISFVIFAITIVSSATSLAAQDPSVFVGKITWIEKLQTEGKTQYLQHYGSCVAINIGTTRHSDRDLNHHILLTAAHVVEGIDNAKCEIQGKEFRAKVILRDTQQDLAYLEVPQSMRGLKSTPYSLLGFSENEKYTAVGYAKDGGLTKATGQVGAWRSYTLTTKDLSGRLTATFKVFGMRFSNICEQGMSGGGVFDSKGNFKGIVVAANDRITVFIPWGKAVGTAVPSR